MKENRKFFVFAILALVAFFLLHNTSWIVDHENPASFVKFLGRFHPLLVHFPIVLVLLTAGLDWYSRKKNNESLRGLTTWFLGATAFFSFISVYLGLMLTAGESYDADLLEWHERFGVLLAVATTLAFLFRSTTLSKYDWSSKASTFLLILGVVFMTIGADKGGSLTHGTGYLTKYLPFGLGSGDSDETMAQSPLRDLRQKVN